MHSNIGLHWMPIRKKSASVLNVDRLRIQLEQEENRG